MSVIGSNGILLVFPFLNVVLTSSDSLNPTLFRSFSIASSHALSSCLCVCLSLSLPLYLSLSLSLFLSLFSVSIPLSLSLFFSLSLFVRRAQGPDGAISASEWIRDIWLFLLPIDYFTSLSHSLHFLLYRVISLCQFFFLSVSMSFTISLYFIATSFIFLSESPLCNMEHIFIFSL